MAIRDLILFRALRDEENPFSEIRTTGSNADLTFEEHVVRGGFRVYKPSQFISTTLALKRALRWVSEDKSALAVIICGLLRQDIKVHNFSEVHLSLPQYYNPVVINYAEVLIEPHKNSPYINLDAIRVCSYSDLVRTYQGSFRPNFLQEMSWEWQAEFFKILLHEFRYRCSFCHGYGHNIDYNHHCQDYVIWSTSETAIQEYYDTVCSFCNQHGHDVDSCHELEVEFEIQRYDTICSYCYQRGHDEDDCNELEVDFAIQRYDTICAYCYQHGHEEDECNELEVDFAIQRYDTICSDCCQRGHDEDDCNELLS